MRLTHWIIRALETIDGYDAHGTPCKLTAGRRGWLERDKAEDATRQGRVMMLSPGGIVAVNRGPKRAKRAPEPAPVAETSKAPPEPVEVEDDVVVAAPPPSPKVARPPKNPSPPRGPQAKIRRPGTR